MKEIKLNELKPGKRGIVAGITGTGALRRRIIDMGITPGAEIMMRKTAPLGDPLQINIRGYELSLRKADAKEITITI
ncbi:MAG: ferrous iron transport protein A [Oscillospiraceae bacterium]